MKKALIAVALLLTGLLSSCTPEEIEAAHMVHDVTKARSLGGLSDSQLLRLRNCESGNNYGAISKSGTYRGAYQFSQATWDATAKRDFPRWVGVRPDLANPDIQDGMARSLYIKSGKGQWPHCGRFLP